MFEKKHYLLYSEESLCFVTVSKNVKPHVMVLQTTK